MKKTLIIIGGYLAVGLARGLYVASQYPGEADQRGFSWWVRAGVAWPYDLGMSLISPMPGSSAPPAGVPTLVANNPTQLLGAVRRAG